MSEREQVSRRHFVSGVAAALGYAALKPESLLYAQARTTTAAGAAQATQQATPTLAEAMATYDGVAKLANNENPYGAPPSVMKAMNDVWRYHSRYGYPDPGIVSAIAKHHGVKNENVMITAGSGELLTVIASTFLDGEHKRVVGAEVTYMSVYSHATNIKKGVIAVPLRADYGVDIPATIRAAKQNYREAGFVYLCNPNNPTGKIVTKGEVKQLLDGLPDDMVVLIDEAYHHFIDNSDYESSVKYVIEGRPVIVIRTFSKIAALAGMRLGYAIAPADLINRMKPYATGTVNALVKYAGVESLKDWENPNGAQQQTKRVNLELRKKTVAALKGFGYDSIPSEGNFFMVGIKRPIQPVVEEFKKRGVLVGRPFPPMTEHMRVSVGNAAEMDRFVKAFGEIFANPVPAPSGGRGGNGRR
jgi:histidinol-phosphate aminotransferase